MDKQNEPVELLAIPDIVEYAEEYRQKKARIDEIEKVFKEQKAFPAAPRKQENKKASLIW